MNLENMMQGKEARHKRTNITGFHIYEVPRIGKFIDTESRTEVTRGWGNAELLFNRHSFTLRE